LLHFPPDLLLTFSLPHPDVLLDFQEQTRRKTGVDRTMTKCQSREGIEENKDIRFKEI
jgi:hypothetical protein